MYVCMYWMYVKIMCLIWWFPGIIKCTFLVIRSPQKLFCFRKFKGLIAKFIVFGLVKRIESDDCRFEQQTEHISPKMWQLEIFLSTTLHPDFAGHFSAPFPSSNDTKYIRRKQQVFGAMGMGPSSEVKGNMVQLVWTSTCCPGLKPLQGGPPAWLKDNYETWWRLVIF